MLKLLYESLVFILPAYVANAMPVLSRGRIPIDFNRKFLDNRPIFGTHKTVEGFLIGLLSALATSLLMDKVLLGISLGIGALIGDLFGSFIKRRLGMPEGSSAPVIDQYGFLFGSFLLVYMLSFFLPVFLPTLDMIIALLLITPPLHFLTNKLADFLHLR